MSLSDPLHLVAFCLDLRQERCSLSAAVRLQRRVKISGSIILPPSGARIARERSCSLLTDIRELPAAPTRLPTRSHRAGSAQASTTSFVGCARAHPTVRSEISGSARVSLSSGARSDGTIRAHVHAV